MTRPSDEELMAYADGRLEEAERQRIEAFLATDADARRLVEGFRRTSDLSGLYGSPMKEEPPQRLVDAIMKGRPEPASSNEQAGGARILRLPERRAPNQSAKHSGRLAMAASVALLIGGLTGYWLAGGTTREEFGGELALGKVPQGSLVARMLETAASGRPQRIRDGDTKGPQLLIVATFRDRNGRPCREVELLDGSAELRPVSAGIACRIDGIGWVMEGASRIAVNAPRGRPDFVPSGVSERDALEGLMQILGASKALSTEEEQTLMRRGWK